MEGLQSLWEYDRGHSCAHPTPDKHRTQYLVQLFKHSKAYTKDNFLLEVKVWLSYEGRESEGRSSIFLGGAVHLWPMEAPGLGVEWKLQLPAYATAIPHQQPTPRLAARPDP